MAFLIQPWRSENREGSVTKSFWKMSWTCCLEHQLIKMGLMPVIPAFVGPRQEAYFNFESLRPARSICQDYVPKNRKGKIKMSKRSLTNSAD